MYLPSQDPDTMPRTVFSDRAGAPPRSQALSGTTRVDVAIVGGGLVGVSAALHALEAGASVAVLETNRIGWGSAGRSAGQVSAHASKLEPEEVLRVYGAERGARLNAAGAQAPEFLRDLARRHAIDLSIVEGGVVSAAHTPQALAKYRRRAEFWQRQGAPVQFLGADEVAALLGSPIYLGGVIDRRAIAVNPLALIWGMARAASDRGALLFEHARVRQLERAGAGWKLRAAGGEVTARNVLLCTNAYTDDLWPGLRRSIIPVRAFQIWTRPVADAVAATILPGIAAFHDSRRLISGARKHAGGRLQFGGSLPLFGPERPPDIDAALRHIRRLFLQLQQIEVEGWWSGWVTRGIADGWRLHELAPGLMTAIACNGRGVAMGPIMGRELVRYLGGTPGDDLLVPVSPLAGILGYSVHKPFAAIAARYFSWCDEREMRRLMLMNRRVGAGSAVRPGQGAVTVGTGRSP